MWHTVHPIPPDPRVPRIPQLTLGYPQDPPWPPPHRRSPSGPLGDPADLSVAHGAADPVTPVLLLHHDAARGAVHGLPLLHQGLGGTSEMGSGPRGPPRTPRDPPKSPQTCSMSRVCRAAASCSARSCSSSWYCRQSWPSWMAWRQQGQCWGQHRDTPEGSGNPPEPLESLEPARNPGEPLELTWDLPGTSWEHPGTPQDPRKHSGTPGNPPGIPQDLPGTTQELPESPWDPSELT